MSEKKHRPTSVFKTPAIAESVTKEEAKIDAEKAKRMTIIEAYDCKYGRGSYQRDRQDINDARLHDPYLAIKYSKRDATIQAISEHKYFKDLEKGVYEFADDEFPEENYEH